MRNLKRKPNLARKKFPRIFMLFLGLVSTITAQGISLNSDILYVTPDTARVGTHGAWLVGLVLRRNVPVGGYFNIEVPRMWQSPQVNNPRASGYTRVWASRNVRFDIAVVRSNLDGLPGYTNAVRVSLLPDIPLSTGDTLFVQFGQHSVDTLGLRANNFSGTQHFIAAVWLPNNELVSKSRSTIKVYPKPASDFKVFVPSTARVGDHINVRIVALDEYGNLDWRFSGSYILLSNQGVRNIANVDSGRATIKQVAQVEGLYRYTLTVGSSVWNSNTLYVSRELRYKVYWGDSHSHSVISNHGYGMPDELFEYARSVSCLDWVVYSEHDYLSRDEYLSYVIEPTNKAYRPDEFVTMIGMEYTGDPKWLGHLTLLSPLSSPPQLNFRNYPSIPLVLQGLRAIGGVAVVNHPFRPVVSFNRWEEINANIVRNVEMANEMESYEFPLAQGGESLRQKLSRGYILGFIGSSDNHMSRPGMHYMTNRVPGLTAVLSGSLTRENVFEALKQRRVYCATNGLRPYIEFTANGYPIGSVIPIRAGTSFHEVNLEAHIAMTQPIDTLRIMKKDGALVTLHPNTNNVNLILQDTLLRAGDYYYLFLAARGGGKAWTSPIFFRYYDPNFRLTEPLSGDTLHAHPSKPIRFSWRRAFADEPSGPIEYALSIQGANLDTLIEVFDDTTANVSILGRLIPSSIYSWYVSAANGKGDVWVSDTAYFRTAGLPTDSPTVAIIYPSSFALFSNYPNPFNSTTEIKYAVAKRATVTLTIFDITGKTIESPVHSLHEPGFYSFTWTANSLSSGIYFCRMEADTHDGATAFRSTAKMVLIR
jgi:hypothetical protein